ncbi:MAG TPA: lysophospholipid acyltransferase family protein [Aliidongia sp.]|nr:lysophospholipid acyltransferase family protein [Aliidongia sp.]
MIRLRAFLFNLGFYAGTGLLAIAGLPLLLRQGWILRYSAFWTRLSLVWLKLSVGLDHQVRGLENLPPPPFILAPKHQSAWDTLILNQLVRDPAIVLKRELTLIPVFGWYLLRAGGLVVDRKAGAAALRKLVAQGRQAVAAGRPIAIFPEGTRGPIGGKLPYQPGVAALYSQLGVPLVPVALNSGRFWGRNTFLKFPGRITVEILPPIAPGLDRRQALALLEERIEQATGRLLTEAGPPTHPVNKVVGNL